jgi:hypothetical protein
MRHKSTTVSWSFRSNPSLNIYGKNAFIFMKCKENHPGGTKSSLSIQWMLIYFVRKLTRNVTTVLYEASCKPQLNNIVLVWNLVHIWVASSYTIALYTDSHLNSPCKHKLQVGFREADTHKGTLGADVNIAMQFLSRGGRDLSQSWHNMRFRSRNRVMLAYQPPPYVV